ncbi:MAG: PTS sugar transporter subunit IIB [bacterium]|nr:MAG: PTS sugar transporter subunit IIB [bacterium]
MPVVLARVDDRLVHGQVVEGWVPFVHADSIYVVNGRICEDESRCRFMRMVVPEHLSFRVLAPADLKGVLDGDDQRKVLLLFDSLTDVLAAVQAGARLMTINVGNLHHVRGGVEVSPSVFLNRKDIGVIRELFMKGIRIEARDVPQGRYYDLYHLMEEDI